MNLKEAKFQYLLQLADDSLILGHRVSEWCGHGPVLEQDIALTNIALDLVGQSRMLYDYAAKEEGKGRTEDDLAFLRDVLQFRNVLLVEQPNVDFAYTIVRQFLFDVFHFYNFRELCQSQDETLRAIAKKSLKEITYHLRFSSEWMIRLGDGTEVSHQKIQRALNDRWAFFEEMFMLSEPDSKMLETGIGVDLEKIRPEAQKKVNEILLKATLTKPEITWDQKGGRKGHHSEHLGHILSEMQFLQRAYPGAEW